MGISIDHIEIDGTSPDSLKEGAQQVVVHVKPNWKKEKLKYKIYTDGITNKLIGVWEEDIDDQVLVRIYGENTDLFINRTAEKENMQLFHANGIGCKLLASFKNGICYDFIPGAPMSIDAVKEEKSFTAICKQMAKLHNIPVKSKEAFLFPKLRQFFDLLTDAFWEKHTQRLSEAGVDKDWLRREGKDLEEALECLGCPVVLCHNDILMNNIIWDDVTQTAHFIDYEYAAPNYQAFDIANHFCEFVGVDANLDYANLYPKAEFQRQWIRHYLSCFSGTPREQVSSEEVERWRRWVNKFALSSHLLWGSWSLLQACHSSIDFDFLGYSIMRFQEYKTRKEEFLSL